MTVLGRYIDKVSLIKCDVLRHVNLLSPQEQPRPPVLSVRRILMTTVAPKMFGYGAFPITSVFRYHLLQALTFTIYEFAKMRPMSG